MNVTVIEGRVSCMFFQDILSVPETSQWIPVQPTICKVKHLKACSKWEVLEEYCFKSPFVENERKKL